MEQQIVGAHLCVCPESILCSKKADTWVRPYAAPTIGTVIQWFKTMSTNEYIRNVKIGNYPPFNTRLWQRNYYEHIIRNESELNCYREYIINNPIRWNNKS